MRFLHTSDWHLGRIFHGLHLITEQETMVNQVIDMAVEAKVDAVVIAGDIYDRAVPPTEAVSLLDAALQRLVLRQHIPVILIAGNHDNPDRLNFGRALFAENKLFIYGPVSGESTPVVLTDKTGPVYFAPLTYCEPLTATELSGSKQSTHEAALQWQIAQMLPQIPEGARKVALAHVFLTGATQTPDSERPLAAGGTANVDINNFAPFNYTALGHLHACQNCSETVRYCGSLLKYSFGEVGQKKAVHIVDMDADGKVQVETLPLKAVHELAVIKGTFAELLAEPRPELFDDYLQVVLTDTLPVLDAKNKLEQVYPHILQLSYEALTIQKVLTPSQGVTSKETSTEELFGTFFQQTNDRPLSTSEDELLKAALDQLSKEGRKL